MEHADLTPRVFHILRELELPVPFIEPVESFSHKVWLTREHVIHYHVIGSVGRLEHEARVATRLPPEALYPEVVAFGRDGNHDWLVTKRIAGVPLSAAWHWLTPNERREAIHQAARALEAVHRSPATDLVPPCLQGDAPVLTRQELAWRLRSLGAPYVPSSFMATDIGPSVMAHGDFNFNQVMWNDGRLTALLDLEMSHFEAPDWDLVPFLSFCVNPARSVPERLEAISRPDDYHDAPLWLKEAYPQMFAFPHLRDRLALEDLVLRFQDLTDHPDRFEEILNDSIGLADKLVELLPPR